MVVVVVVGDASLEAQREPARPGMIAGRREEDASAIVKWLLRPSHSTADSKVPFRSWFLLVTDNAIVLNRKKGITV